MPSPTKIIQRREWEHTLTFKCRFCGGTNCKRCGRECALSKKDSPIYGLHADWITPQILAMMRPSSSLIQEFNLFGQFHKNGITAVFNLTIPGEHPYCGYGLTQSGFPYDPEEFMAEKISFYNFGWEDMTTPTLTLMMDIVRVTSSLIIEGKNKISVHCHAGYGRTGLAIACTLMYIHKLLPIKAIEIVRRGRPGSIQTIKQVEFVSEFYDYLYAQTVSYAMPSVHEPFTIFEAVERQSRSSHVVHIPSLKYVPKIVDYLCKIIEETVISSNNKDNESITEKIILAYIFHLPPQTKYLNETLGDNTISSAPRIASMSSLSFKQLFELTYGLSFSHFLDTHRSEESQEATQNATLFKYKLALNKEEWSSINESNSYVAGPLLLDWLEHLKNPLLKHSKPAFNGYKSNDHLLLSSLSIPTATVQRERTKSLTEEEKIQIKWSEFNQQPMVLLKTLERIKNTLKLLLSMTKSQEEFLLILKRTGIALYKFHCTEDKEMVSKSTVFIEGLIKEWKGPRRINLKGDQLMEQLESNKLHIHSTTEDIIDFIPVARPNSARPSVHYSRENNRKQNHDITESMALTNTNEGNKTKSIEISIHNSQHPPLPPLKEITPKTKINP